MKKLLVLIFSLLSLPLWADFSIPKGTFYYDNSVTQFKTVKFVYGFETSSSCFVKAMTYEGNNQWSITFNNPLQGNFYRYTFADTQIKEGHYSVSFPEMKNMISKRGEVRTATTDKPMIARYIFVPEDNENHNWYQGNWETRTQCHPHSNTIPVVYLNTQGKQPIESKEVYVPGSLYIDALNNPGYSSLGTETYPAPLRVKGRGNYTWLGFDKKPYRIKFDQKHSVLNMPRDKNFAFLAHADDDLVFLRNTVGFALSRYFGLSYTPRQEPVELFLNNSYVGMYLLTEHIRVDRNRVAVTKQMDRETDPKRITGGWLLEIDNYEADNQFKFWENEEEVVWVTYKSPDTLSTQQFDYMQNFLERTNDAVNNWHFDYAQWKHYIDMDSLVNFYIIQEIMNNRESFHGSCYMHKERGENTKLIFGPVWDFGNSYRDLSEEFIYENPPFGDVWIDKIAQDPYFQAAVQARWKEKRGNLMPYLRKEINTFIDKIANAAICDCKRWSDYGTKNPEAKKEEFLYILNNRLQWLDSKWGTVDVEETPSVSLKVYPNPTHGRIHVHTDASLRSISIYDLSGQLQEQYAQKDLQDLMTNSQTLTLSIHLPAGVYLMRVETQEQVQTLKLIIQ